MPGKSRKQLKNNKSKKNRSSRSNRKQRKTKRGGIFGIPSMGVFKPTNSTNSTVTTQQSDTEKINEGIRAALNSGITQEQLQKIHGIMREYGYGGTKGAQLIRQLLRGTTDTSGVRSDQIYKAKIMALTEMYGRNNAVLSSEINGFFR
jgi:hypothetical protein